MYQNELQHYGVKGMRWGHRKKREYTPLQQKKIAYKTAKKDFNRAYLKADTGSIAAFSPVKKHRQANDKRWRDVSDKAKSLDKAKSDYKSAKKQAKANMTPEEKAARRKKAIKIGAAAAGTALAAYGTYKVVQAVQNKKAMERGRIAAEKAAKRYQMEAKYLAERAEQLRKAGSIHGRVQSGGNIIEW